MTRIFVRLVLLAPIALAPMSAGAQRLGQGGGDEVSLWRVLAALIVCLALAVSGALALRRRMGGGMPLILREGRRLELIESLRISHQVDLCLVRCDGREWLVAATPHGATFGPDVRHAPLSDGE